MIEDLTTRLFPDAANPGSFEARAACPRCRQWTPLDCRICLTCGRPLPWKGTHWHQIVAERRRRGTLAWVNTRDVHGTIVDGHHFDWGDPIIKVWEGLLR